MYWRPVPAGRICSPTVIFDFSTVKKGAEIGQGEQFFVVVVLATTFFGQKKSPNLLDSGLDFIWLGRLANWILEK